MGLVFGFLAGALIGWIGSLVMRTDTSQGIWADIAAGAAGGVFLPLVLDTSSTFDRLIAAALGALLALTLTHGIRRYRGTRPQSDL